METRPLLLLVTDAPSPARPLIADFDECARLVLRRPRETAQLTLRGVSRCAGLVVELSSLKIPALNWLTYAREEHPRLPMLAAAAAVDARLINELHKLRIDLIALPSKTANCRAFAQVAARRLPLATRTIKDHTERLAARHALTRDETNAAHEAVETLLRGVGCDGVRGEPSPLVLRSLHRKLGVRSPESLAKNVLRAVVTGALEFEEHEEREDAHCASRLVELA